VYFFRFAKVLLFRILKGKYLRNKNISHDIGSYKNNSYEALQI